MSPSTMFGLSLLLLLDVCNTRHPQISAVPIRVAVASVTSPPAPDSLAAERDSLMQTVLDAIAGREEEPAESVFVNIDVFRGVPAGRIPRIMNMGFSRSLGVSCEHCHAVGEWEKEDGGKKEIAREMMRMVQAINTEYLGRIEGLESDDPVVNCTTCHRGQVKPALNLP